MIPPPNQGLTQAPMKSLANILALPQSFKTLEVKRLT
jgi:hypothetical protein